MVLRVVMLTNRSGSKVGHCRLIYLFSNSARRMKGHAGHISVNALFLENQETSVSYQIWKNKNFYLRLPPTERIFQEAIKITFENFKYDGCGNPLLVLFCNKKKIANYHVSKEERRIQNPIRSIEPTPPPANPRGTGRGNFWHSELLDVFFK